jgi:hypothetical protein
MIDLIKVIASDRFFDIIGYVKDHPEENSSSIARALEIHIVTVQRSLDTLERYGFVASEVRKKPGRPSRAYRYLGGTYSIDLDAILSEFELKDHKIRESGRPDIGFSFDVDKELVNAILVGGKQGEAIKLDEKMGKFFWFVPPPDSSGETIASLAERAGISVVDAIRFVLEMRDRGAVEILG